MNICCSKHCFNTVTSRVRISFGATSTGPRASFLYPVLLCDACISDDPNNYVTDEGWAQITSQFIARGLVPPDRTTISVAKEPLK